MPEAHVLNSKDTKLLYQHLQKCYDTSFKPKGTWLRKDKKYFLFSGDFIPEVLRINTVGLYIGEWKNEEFRFSIEGAQLFGKSATHHVEELSEEKMQLWFKGEDCTFFAATGFAILKYGTDIIGCGKIKDDVLLNFVPKARRIVVH